MKKIALLFTLTLCAGALNGMEPERGRYTGLGELPKEIQAIIITYLNEYNNVDSVINALKAMSRTNKSLNKIIVEKYGNLQGFTELVQKLAKRFDKLTEEIAFKFKTSASEYYISLGQQLVRACLEAFDQEGLDRVAQLIQDGADVNYSANWVYKTHSTRNIGRHYAHPLVEYEVASYMRTPMYFAIKTGNYELIKLLLNSGAELKSNAYYDEHDFWPGINYFVYPNDASKDKEVKEFINDIRKQY